MHYNSRSIAPLSLPAHEAPPFYDAYRRFAPLLREARFQLRTRLGGGTLVVFDNQRILHGRTRVLLGAAAAPSARLLPEPRQRLQRDGAAAPLRWPRAARMSLAADILAIYRARGAQAYFGERVSMTEHGLQAAHFAQAEGAPGRTRAGGAAARHRPPARERCPDPIEEWTRRCAP